MIKENSFAELARDCVRACHVLKTVTEGRDGDNLSGLSEKQIEDLGRCVTPDQFFLLKITSDNRVIRHIESVVSECSNWYGYRSQEYPGHIKQCLIAGRTEMRQILRTFDVRGFQPIVDTVSEPPQGDLGRGSVLVISEIGQHVGRFTDAEPPVPASVVVRCCVATSTPLAADPPFDIGHVSVIHWRNI